MTTGAESSRYEHQRQQAIRSAAAVFAEKGFHGASTRDIAERMGIKQGSLYYYFKSKPDILRAIVDKTLDQIVETTGLGGRDTDEGVGGGRVGVRVLVHGFVSWGSTSRWTRPTARSR